MRSVNFNPQGLVGILCSRAEVHIMMGHGSEALSDLDRAWGTAGEIKPLDLRRQLQLDCLRTRCGVYTLHGDYPELKETAQQALEISRANRDRKGEAEALHLLGQVQYLEGECEPALAHYERSLAIKEVIGDRPGQASTQNNIGVLYHSLSDYPKALEWHQRSLAIRQEIGDLKGVASSLNNIGNTHDALGDYPRALEHHQRSMEIRQRIGDRQGEAASWNNIGLVHYSLGEYPQSLECNQRSLAIRKKIEDRQGEGTSLRNLGIVYHALGDYPEALDSYRLSLTLARKIGDRQGEMKSQSFIGVTYAEQGAWGEAEETFREAERLAEETGNRFILANALAGLASLYLNLGNSLGLVEEWIDRLNGLGRELDSREFDGTVLNLRGRLHVRRREGPQAKSAFQEAIALFREIRNPLALGEACYYFGQGFKDLGEEREGDGYLAQAREIFQRLGAQGWLRKIEAGKEPPGDKA